MDAVDGDEVRWNDSARSFYVIDPDRRRVDISQHGPGGFLVRLTCDVERVPRAPSPASLIG